MSSNSGLLYGSRPDVPSYGMLVTYVLSQEEYNRYQVQSVYPATISFIRTPMSLDLSAVVNVPSAIQKSAPITNFSIASNVVTFTAANNFANGDVVAISGLSVGTYLNGQNLTVVNPSGTQFTAFAAAFTHANVGSTSDSGTAKQIQATLTPLAVSFGPQQRGWYPGVTYLGVLPTGSPW